MLGATVAIIVQKYHLHLCDECLADFAFEMGIKIGWPWDVVADELREAGYYNRIPSYIRRFRIKTPYIPKAANVNK